VRRFIEPEIARLAALSIKPEYKKRLKEAIKAEEQPTESLLKDIDNKTLVHFILAEMCGNRLYEAFLRLLIGINRKVVEVVKPDFRHMHPAGMHHPIVEAVSAGDGEAACEAMRKHAIEFGEASIAMEEEYKRNIAAGKTEK
jgi:GntR family transcriptional regulator, transcriptional repressor for pyruvate dehydrogenase complex